MPRGWSSHIAPSEPNRSRTDPLDKGILFDWPMLRPTGNRVPDFSGANRVGTVTTGTAWIGTPYGPALSFLRTSSQQATSPDLEAILTTLGQITFEVLFRETDSGADFTVRPLIGTQQVSGATFHGGLYVATSNNRLGFRLGTGTTNSTITVDGAYTTGLWYVAHATYDGANMRLYLNGLQIASAARTGTWAGNSSGDGLQQIYLANYVSGGYLSVDIAAARVYRRGLRAGEVMKRFITLMNNDHVESKRWYFPQSWANFGRTGTLTATLAALTSSAAGTVDIAGTLSKTLGVLTSSAAGTVDLTGQLSKTLDSLTSSATGALDIQGTLTKTLDSLSITAEGNSANNGALTATLGALTSAAAGTVDIAGSASITLSALTSSAAGTLDITATANVTLGALTSSATGQLQVQASALITLSSLTSAATGTVDLSGNLTSTLGNVTSNASGALAIQGVLAKNLDNLAISAQGTANNTGLVNATLGVLTLSAASTISGGVAADVIGIPLYDDRGIPMLFDTRVVNMHYDYRTIPDLSDTRTIEMHVDTRRVQMCYDMREIDALSDTRAIRMKTDTRVIPMLYH